LRWLQSVFGSDGSPIVQYVVIFAVIFTALAAIVFTVRRLTGRNLALPGRAGGRGRQPRLGIVDVYELDRARQLILLRRDNVEHLLLVGGPNDVVVERNIQRTQRPLPEASLRSEPAPDALDEPLPDPLVQGGRLPEPPRALADTAGRRAEPLFDPGFAMPVVVPPPVPRSAAAPPVTLPLDAALLGGDEPGQDVSAPLAPEPVAEAPVAPPRAPRESTIPRRILSRTAPPLAESPPRPASERKVEAEPAESGAAQAPSLAVPSERRSVDPAILSDMARQLQAALSRPSSAVTPAPVPAAQEGVDPVAAAMASAPPAPAPEPMPAAAIPDRPAAPATPEPPVVPPAPATAPEPVPAPRPPAPPPAQPVLPKAAPAFEPPGTRSDAKSAGNPFSVEEIEAEFARLLGRPLDKRN
jgi:flagellar protein FliO/FliZ